MRGVSSQWRLGPRPYTLYNLDPRASVTFTWPHVLMVCGLRNVRSCDAQILPSSPNYALLDT